VADGDDVARLVGDVRERHLMKQAIPLMVGAPDVDIGAEDPVGEQAEAGEVGEPRALGEPGQDREMQPGPQARDAQVVADDPLQGRAGRRPAGGLADGLGKGVVGAAAEQGHEPQQVEADHHHHPVEGQPFPALVVVDLHDDLASTGSRWVTRPARVRTTPARSSSSWTWTENTPRSVRLRNSRRCRSASCRQPAASGSEYMRFSVKLSPRV
jgi:hypothetical protein